MDQQYEDYRDNHGSDHEGDVREEREAMDLRDSSDALGL